MERAYYAVIPANIRYDENLTPNAKLLYGEITALANERGYCWATNTYFAELYGVSKTSISKWIKQLVDSGYIKSQIIYKEGTKEILNRYLTIVVGGIEEKLNRYPTFINEGIEDKLSNPIEEKLKDNNTILNNTINNINTISKDIVSSTKVQPIIDKWNELGLQKLISINKGTNRYKLLQARLKEYGQDKILQAIENIKCSSFLKGQNNKNWAVTFDWLVKPNNFIKILEGNYVDRENPVKIAKNKEVQPLRFNNFEPRKYDYDNLEKKLLGWDNDD
ncbi:helix-turn-helix domain-containing protein [Clostridium beijerinckii]|uniref:helix-turn-helix domain-containing protein n=1 Tax=Clostridium beijerinckii TaxID=1520 RepID=UPI0002EB044D|nr:helix-turn-helix domain-containing protein [Clostridium beijerinckii]